MKGQVRRLHPRRMYLRAILGRAVSEPRALLRDVHGEADLFRSNLRSKRAFGNVVFACILLAIRYRVRIPKVVETLSEFVAGFQKPFVVHTAGPIDDERRQHVEAGVIQYPVLNRE